VWVDGGGGWLGWWRGRITECAEGREDAEGMTISGLSEFSASAVQRVGGGGGWGGEWGTRLMTRKRQSTEPKRATLQMPRSEAEARIQEQIEKGRGLLELRIRTEAELERARDEEERWSNYNVELLRCIVDTDELAHEYRPPHLTGGFVISVFAIKVKEFYGDVRRNINCLESILERLSLIPELPALAQPTKGISIDEQRAHLQKLLETHQRNLHQLEERAAKYGLDQPISLLNQMEYERAEIARSEQELSALEKAQIPEDTVIQIEPVSDSAVAMGPTVVQMPAVSRPELSQELDGVREAIAELGTKLDDIVIQRAAVASIFGDMEIQQEEDLCFVLMPFRDDMLQQVYEVHIKPTVERVGLQCKRVDDMLGPAAIMVDIWKGINSARVVLAELTGQNPNVFYELGLCHAIGKDAILIAQDIKDVPFDVRHRRTIIYTPTPRGCKQLEEVLGKTLATLLGKVPAESVA